jgi:hypothetical protein
VAAASSSAAFVADAVVHFVAGYAWANAVIARPITAPLAMFGIAMAGAFTRVALAMGTAEAGFAWIGPLAAIALSDSTSTRNVVSSVVAFAVGYVALIWLSP